MSWTFVNNYLNTRGNRNEIDIELPSGEIVAIRNNDYSYGRTQYWGVLLCQDYQLLGGGDPLFHNQVLLYQKSHSLVLTNPTGGTVQPSFYYPENAPTATVGFALFRWEP